MDVSWRKLSPSVDKRLLDIIRQKFGFKKMTLVQASAIPQMIKLKDVVVQAATGSGKTLSFLLPMMNHLINLVKESNQEVDEDTHKYQIRTIILSPTRELAQQTLQVLKKFVPFQVDDNMTLNCIAFIGGPNPCIDIAKFETHGGQIVVATPGRLLEVMERSDAITTYIRKNLEILILDEVDHLLSANFDRYMNPILAKLPKLRRTWIFSATQAKHIEDLMKLGLRDPIRVDVREKRPAEEEDSKEAKKLKKSQEHTEPAERQPAFELPSRLLNYYVKLDKCEDKLPFLLNLITNKATANYYKKIIVFVTSCVQVNYYAHILKHYTTRNLQKFPVLKIHRKLKKKRHNLFTQFKTMEKGMLISTDLMARGVDIPKVDLVINCDLPTSLESFVHRSGRSGHQVHELGTSLIILLPNEDKFIPFLQKKGVQIDPFPSIIDKKFDTDKVLAWIRKEAVRDESFYTLGLQSFVAYIRSYSSKWNNVFFEKLDPIDPMNGFGLLKKPTMPELRTRLAKCKTELKATEAEKAVAKQRMQESAVVKQTATAEARKIARAEAKQEDRKKTKKPKGMKRWEFLAQEDIEEINRDARLIKKRRKMKITEKDFEQKFLTKSS